MLVKFELHPKKGDKYTSKITGDTCTVLDVRKPKTIDECFGGNPTYLTINHILLDFGAEHPATVVASTMGFPIDIFEPNFDRIIE